MRPSARPSRFLRQPQLAGLLPPRDEDAGLRALGRPGFRAPDNVLIPTGAGSNVLGCDIGFGELLRRGEIEQLPRLFAVQPANCAPLCASFASGAADYMPVETLPTIAEGTAIAKPVRTREVLAAIRRSGGTAVSVSEEEIVEAMTDLAKSAHFQNLGDRSGFLITHEVRPIDSGKARYQAPLAGKIKKTSTC